MNFKLINCLIVCFCASSTLVFSAGPATSCFSIADGDFDDDNTWNCDGVAGGILHLNYQGSHFAHHSS